MSLISIPNTFTVGAVIVASQHNSNFSTIYSDYNGNITNDNISAAAGIVDTKLAQITTASKVSTSALTGSLVGLAYAFPAGGIIMWSGTIATIPSGWFLCNGSNGTPDLRNRFIVSADADVGGIAKSTITGAALQTSDGQIPAHTHDVVAQFNPGTGAAGSGNSGGNTTLTTTSFGTGTYNVARFYALAYIMKS